MITTYLIIVIIILKPLGTARQALKQAPSKRQGSCSPVEGCAFVDMSIYKE